MDLEHYLAAARHHVSWFTDLAAGAVSGYILGGWNAVIGLAAFALIMFLLTSLLSRRD
jgi:ABC-type Mn2+/Zn2+ transport system permease subunit